MQSNISLIIIDSDLEVRNLCTAQLKRYGDTVRINGSVADFPEGLKLIQSTNPAIVIIEVHDLARGVKEIKQLHSLFPHLSILVTSREKNSDWILSLMRAGAVEYLLKPLVPGDLEEALQKIGRLTLARPAMEPEKTGEIIALYNPVGGVGTTTISVNLAAALAVEGSKVALIDLNFFSGDVAAFLDVDPPYTLSSVTSNTTRLDTSFLMSVMTRHSSGIYVLTEPIGVEEVSGITPEQVSRMLQFMKKTFDYLVIDTGGYLAGNNLAAFEHADHILFNTVLSLPALKNTKRYLAAIERHGFNRDRLKLIVNRYIPKADIRVEDAERTLGFKVFIAIPNEYSEVVGSINKGIPMVKLYPRSSVSKAVIKLAEMLKR